MPAPLPLQDAEEYWGHLLQLLSRAEHAAGERLPGARDAPTARLFTYGTEDRIQCSETGRVRGVAHCVPAGLCAELHQTSRGTGEGACRAGTSDVQTSANGCTSAAAAYLTTPR